LKFHYHTADHHKCITIADDILTWKDLSLKGL